MRFAETSGFLPTQMPNFRSFHAEQGAATVRNDKPNQSPIGSDPAKTLARPRHTIPRDVNSRTRPQREIDFDIDAILRLLQKPKHSK
jgi:hypothetical protein